MRKFLGQLLDLAPYYFDATRLVGGWISSTLKFMVCVAVVVVYGPMLASISLHLAAYGVGKLADGLHVAADQVDEKSEAIEAAARNIGHDWNVIYALEGDREIGAIYSTEMLIWECVLPAQSGTEKATFAGDWEGFGSMSEHGLTNCEPLKIMTAYGTVPTVTLLNIH